jgi:hypothetical protein
VIQNMKTALVAVFDVSALGPILPADIDQFIIYVITPSITFAGIIDGLAFIVHRRKNIEHKKR